MVSRSRDVSSDNDSGIGGAWLRSPLDRLYDVLTAKDEILRYWEDK